MEATITNPTTSKQLYLALAACALVAVVGYAFNAVAVQHVGQGQVERAIAALPKPKDFFIRVGNTTFTYRANQSDEALVAAAPASVQVTIDPNEVDDMRLDHPPSLDAAQIDAILADYSSPATGSGQSWVTMGEKYGIDPAYAVAFFIHESTAGTNPNWAGIKSDGSSTHNIGNITCTGSTACYGRFRDYSSWEAGIEDWFRLIRDEYIQGRGLATLDQVLPIYAPAFENDVDGYKSAVAAMVAGWRRAQLLVAPQEGATTSVPIAVGDSDFGFNVRAALDASGGALRDVTIQPGEMFSFNATIGNPAGLDLRVVGGVIGGGWCDLAARYIQAVRPLNGVKVQFKHHGLQLNDVAWEDSVSIWNIGGQSGFQNGSQDLLITNGTGHPLRLLVQPSGDQEVVVTAALQ